MMIRIQLSQGGPSSGRYEAIIDDEDNDLADRRWRFYTSSGKTSVYAGRTHPKWECLHRIILARAIGRELLRNEECDHIDGDGLNNRRANLRIATRSQNAANRSAHGVSPFLGVDRRKNRWRAKLMKAGVDIHLGQYATEEEAARAYDRAAREHHGEYARLNFPDGDA